MRTNGGTAHAANVVVALGPWSDTVFHPLGYHIPLLPKRGYHMHDASDARAPLQHPVCDIEHAPARFD